MVRLVRPDEALAYVLSGPDHAASVLPESHRSDNADSRLMLLGLLLACMTAEVAMAQSSNATSTSEVALDAYRAAIDEWETAAELACTFQYRQTFAKTFDDALHGRWDDTLGPGGAAVNAQGAFYKMGRLVRYRLDYPDPPALAKGAADTRPAGVSPPQLILTRVSFDESSNSEIRSSYHFPHGAARGLNLIRFDPHPGARAYVAGILSSTMLHPLNPLANAKGIVLELWSLGGDPESHTVDLTDVDPERIQFTLECHDGTPRQQRIVTLWKAPTLPVVESITERYLTADGHTSSEKRTVLSRFVNCNDVMVASRVLRMKRSGDDPVQVSSWISHDLAQRAPRDNDFVITVQPDTTVIGLSRLPRVEDGVRAFDMTRLRTTDVREQHNMPSPEATDAHSSSSRVRFGATIIGSVVLVIFCAIALSRRHK